MVREPIEARSTACSLAGLAPERNARRAIGIEAGTVDFGNVAQRTAAAGSLNLGDAGTPLGVTRGRVNRRSRSEFASPRVPTTRTAASGGGCRLRERAATPRHDSASSRPRPTRRRFRPKRPSARRSAARVRRGGRASRTSGASTGGDTGAGPGVGFDGRSRRAWGRAGMPASPAPGRVRVRRSAAPASRRGASGPRGDDVDRHGVARGGFGGEGRRLNCRGGWRFRLVAWRQRDFFFLGLRRAARKGRQACRGDGQRRGNCASRSAAEARAARPPTAVVGPARRPPARRRPHPRARPQPRAEPSVRAWRRAV